MPVHRSSRYLRQPRIVVVDNNEEARRVFEQRDTTVFKADRAEGTKYVTIHAGDDLPDIARRLLGRQQLWWIVADHNPEAFFPLDLEDGDQLYVPPARAVSRFRRR